MAVLQAGSILRQLRRAALRPDNADMSDGQLLRSFLSRRDEAAFEALVRRHGPMVRGVCRRVLRNAHDAEDAFQAAFLVLVRKAADLAVREVVGDWLHGVAHRTALKARAAEARRRFKESQAPRREALEEEARPEWLALLDQEVGRLPEKYRLPVVLCDLEGRTRKEAAHQLGWPEGTLSGRLARARAMLARRLTRRGVTLSGGALTAALAGEAVASLPVSLVRSTSRAATVFAAGQATGVVSAQVVALTEGVVKAMLLTKLKSISVLLMVLAVAIGIGARRHAAAGQGEERQQDKPVPTTRDRPKVPVIPAANRNFQIDLRITREKQGQRKVLATPTLLTLEGRQASFAIGNDYVFTWGELRQFERVTAGPAVRLVVRSEKGGQIGVDMTASHSLLGSDPANDFIAETKSVRIIRKVELGQPVTVKLKMGEKEQTMLEVTAAVTAADANGTIEAAEKDLKMAEFYERTGHADSACFYYEIICQRYPSTHYAKRAAEHLAKLKPPAAPYSKQPTQLEQDKEQSPARVGQIFIIGNTRTRQSVILKQVPLYPGQVLNRADLRIAERNLSQLKGLKSAKINVLNPEDDSVFKNIQIRVEEK